MNAQLLAKGFIARGGQIIDATLVPAPPRQHLSKEEKELVGEGAMPADWTPAKRRQKEDVYADRGYSSEARQEQLKEAGERNHIRVSRKIRGYSRCPNINPNQRSFSFG